MARKSHLPADLSPAQVIALQDALLANADQLLHAALTMLDSGNVTLARSLAILGMEESGKAIALHNRRVRMADVPEGEAFLDAGLRRLWGDHVLKLDEVHGFLVREQYWFGSDWPLPEENERVLGTIDEWKRDHNTFKQRGFYVDVSPAGDPITPQDTADAQIVRAVVGHIHQIGWQLRLGEHIEGKRRMERERDVPPMNEDDIQGMRTLMRRVDQDMSERILESMRKGTQGKKLNNEAYAFRLPDNPLENLGRSGYEAHDRELWALMQDPGEAPDV
ncbi:hypothetical protein GCM10027449_18530 [Sinomonas notoginsengisoli]|uniref:AbiV family abortive infection protein n=1 Tax=Sinomonas notoginsengisoli TaxID=1457311 RepID=UPI001F2C9C4B|nr:AbiV family abortive infection protein [Sinomonas notoginsengisoli]